MTKEGPEFSSFHPEDRKEREENQARLKVAICSTPWLAVPPKSYGGIEALIYDFLINYPGENVDYFLYTVGETTRRPTTKDLTGEIGYHYESIQYERIKEPNAHLREAIHIMNFYHEMDRRIKNGEECQIIHHHLMFMGGVFTFGKRINLPHLISIHGPIEDEVDKEFLLSLKDEPGIYFTSISNNQGRHLPQLPWVKTVYNGVNVEKFPLQKEKKDFLLNIGRINKDKGQAEAIEIARRLGKSLVLAGNIEDQEYFDREIDPKVEVWANRVGSAFKPMEVMQTALERATMPEVIYVGEANFEDKVWLYQNAKVFLNPINWEEPFGLVMPEAMACGTPVVSLARGAAPEIIAHGKTGFLVSDVDEMTQEVEKILKDDSLIHPEDCREHVVQNFSAEVMAKNYREAYDEVLRREKERTS